MRAAVGRWLERLALAAVQGVAILLQLVWWHTVRRMPEDE